MAKARAKRGPIDYIRKHSSSSVLWFRYIFPKAMGWKDYEKSLGTRDLQVARGRAAPHLMKCVAWVEEAKARRDDTAERRQVATLSWRHPPDLKGVHPLADGRTVQIIDGMCLYAADGVVVEMLPNLVRTAVEGEFWTRAEYQGAVNDGHLGDGQLLEWDCPEWRGETIELPPHIRTLEQCRAPVDGGVLRIPAKEAQRSKARLRTEDELATRVEQWLSEGHKTRHIRQEAERVLVIWREISEGKPLKECNRADGVKLRDHLLGKYKTQTVQKLVGHLGAALNYAALEHDYVGPNPFKRLVTRKLKRAMNDRVRTVAFSEAEMAKVRAALKTWKDIECVRLWVLCATTGMRRGEAFLIDGEERIGAGLGLRCIRIIPTNEDDSIKNDESERTIPIPADALRYLPDPIEGRLFNGTPDSVGKRLAAKLRKLGVTGRGKTLRSTRTRAGQRIQHVPVNGQYSLEKMRYEILGHERGGRKVADSIYAGEFPKDILKPVIDVIGLGPTDSFN